MLKRLLPRVGSGDTAGSGADLMELLKPKPWFAGRARLKLLSLESEPRLRRVGATPAVEGPADDDGWESVECVLRLANVFLATSDDRAG